MMTTHNKLTNKTIGNTYWLCHMDNWFAFIEPAEFVFDHENGGYFASIRDERHIFSVAQNGYSEPSEDVFSGKDLEYPLDYRGYQIYANLKGVDKSNPLSGHEWREMQDAKGFVITGPGTHSNVYSSLKSAKEEVDFLIKFPSPVLNANHGDEFSP